MAGSGKYPSLEDRVCIVTGGGRGLGLEMALALVGEGSRVVVTSAREAAELADVSARAQEIAGPGRLIARQADVRDYGDCEAVVAAAIEQFGRVDCLVNNAGRGMLLISERFNKEPALFWHADPDAWREIIDTNVNGAFNMARAAVPHMVDQGFGRVVNISTSDITMIRTGYSPYGPSKAALEAMSRVWAADLAGTGVTVNVFLPGGASDTKLLPDGPDKKGSDGNLLPPSLMRAPILWLCADDSNGHTGERYIARLWDDNLAPVEAAAQARDRHHEKPGIM